MFGLGHVKRFVRSAVQLLLFESQKSTRSHLDYGQCTVMAAIQRTFKWYRLLPWTKCIINKKSPVCMVHFVRQRLKHWNCIQERSAAWRINEKYASDKLKFKNCTSFSLCKSSRIAHWEMLFFFWPYMCLVVTVECFRAVQNNHSCIFCFTFTAVYILELSQLETVQLEYLFMHFSFFTA